MHFPLIGQRITLRWGTVVLLHPSQPHALVARGNNSFREAYFPPDLDGAQAFLGCELPIGNLRWPRRWASFG